MKPPGADVLTHAVRGALDSVDGSELRLINAMSSAEVAEALVEQYDEAQIRATGHRATPEFLRAFAHEAEEQAKQFRRIAERREREAS